MGDCGMKSLISIIIPVFNGEQFIEKCLESVMNQTYKDLQIIVIDDGSTDNTYQILKDYRRKDLRIEIIHQSNGGVSKARNTGLESAKGQWLCFVDADDYIETDYCENMLNTVKELDADVLIAGEIESVSYDSYLHDKNKLIQACLSYDEQSFPFNIDAPWGKIFKLSTIKDNNIFFPERLTRSEDAYFCMSFYNYANKISYLNYSGYRHIEREGSLCRSYSPSSVNMLEIIIIENQKWVNANFKNDSNIAFSLWYRVLPGIVECEKSYFLHMKNNASSLKKLKDYQIFLNQKIIKKAIKNLSIFKVKQSQFKLRLLLYKLHLGWLFFLIKMKKECKNGETI